MIYKQHGGKTECPKCGANASYLETRIFDKTTVAIFCACCGRDWKEPVEVREVQGR